VPPVVQTSTGSSAPAEHGTFATLNASSLSALSVFCTPPTVTVNFSGTVDPAFAVLMNPGT
jgi:hypothetical protein